MIVLLQGLLQMFQFFVGYDFVQLMNLSGKSKHPLKEKGIFFLSIGQNRNRNLKISQSFPVLSGYVHITISQSQKLSFNRR